MAIKTCISSAFAMAGALSMGTSFTAPAFAAESPAVIVPAAASAVMPVGAGWDTASENAQRHRYRRYRRDRGADAGDVVAGVVILGTIAAIASAVSNNGRDRDHDSNSRYRERDYRDSRDRRWNKTNELNRAVDSCVRSIERNVRIESVDTVDRAGSGWRVTGSLYDGASFTCRVGPDGRIEGVDYGANYRGADAAVPADDYQWCDDRYAAAWQNEAGTGASSAQAAIRTPNSVDRLPAYPSGPIDGEAAQIDLPADSGGYYIASPDGDVGG